MGFRIFFHSVKLVFSQLGGALRISGLLYLISLILSAIAVVFLVVASSQQPTFAWQSFLAFALAWVPYLWIAVGWHRFVLLDELSTGPVPVLHGDRLLAYFGRGLQIGLVLVVTFLVMGVIMTILIAVSNGSTIVAIATSLVLITIALVISYRLAPIFPGAAIGTSIGVGEAWTATRGASGTIVALAIISAIASELIDLPAQALQFLPGGAWLAFAWAAITGWVKLMVGVSILTTLYGVYIDKRAIA